MEMLSYEIAMLSVPSQLLNISFIFVEFVINIMPLDATTSSNSRITVINHNI